jgi:hypothetical protein
MGDDSLEVPGPVDEDPVELDMVLVVAWAVCYSLAFLAIGVSTEIEWRTPMGDSAGPVESSYDYKQLQKEILDEDKSLEYVRDQVRESVLVGSLRHGPYRLNELICAAFVSQLEKGLLSEPMLKALRERVRAAKANAPWHCLLDLYLRDQLENVPSLRRQVESFWTKLKQEKVSKAIAIRVLKRYRQMENPPDNEQFWNWMISCGLRVKKPRGQLCREILADRAPEFGMDIMMLMERQLRDGPPEDPILERIIDMTAHIASDGQPAGWRVDETVFFKEYGRLIKIAAVFQLCRFLNTPEKPIRQRAARHLSNLSEIQNRRFSAEVLGRWTQACKRAFGSRSEEAHWRAPVLAVVRAKSDKTPEYSFESLIDRGHCSRNLGRPLWTCAENYWNSSESPSTAMRGYYIATTAE